MSISVKYKLTGGAIDLVSLRKQDFVGLFSFPFDSRKITWKVEDVNVLKALQLIQTSPDCYKLQLRCDIFKLKQEQYNFAVTILYRGNVHRRIDICIIYPKEEAKYVVSSKLNDITWGNSVNCGFLKVIPSNSNIGTEWWQYFNIKCLYIKNSKDILVKGAKIVNFDGSNCFVIPLKPKQSENINITFIGQGISPDRLSFVDVEYFLDKWYKVTFSVTPQKQDFTLSLNCLKKRVSSSKAEEIFEVDITPKKNSAPRLQVAKVTCTENSCIDIQSKKTNNDVIRYSVIFNPGKITYFPLSISPEITIHTLNCGTKSIKFSIIPNHPQQDNQIQFCPDSIFDFVQIEKSYYPEELADGIEFKIINRTQLKIKGISLHLKNNPNLLFPQNNKNCISNISLGGKESLTYKVKSSEINLHLLSGKIKLGIEGTDFCQTFDLKIQVKKKHLNLPAVEISNILDREYCANAVLFECRILNVVYPTDSIFSLDSLDVSKLGCSDGFAINPASSISNVGPGESISLSVRLKKDISSLNDLNFKLLYDSAVIFSKDVIFVQSAYKDDIEGDVRNLVYPGQNPSPIPLGRLIFQEDENLNTVKRNVIEIRLPLILKKYRIEPDCFSFENGVKEIEGIIGSFNFYLNVRALWDNQPINIENPIDLDFRIFECVGKQEDIYAQETLHVLPISANPVIECRYKHELVCRDIEYNEYDLDIQYTNSELYRKGHTKEIAIIEISNVQSLPIPIEIAIVKASIRGQSYGNEHPVDLFSLNKSEFRLSNSTSDELALIFDVQKFVEIKSTYINDDTNYEVGIGIEYSDNEELILIFKGHIQESVQGDWYSLDLGTTGIVIAKRENDGRVVPVAINNKEEDGSKLLESDSNIISSIMGIHGKDNEQDEILLEEDQDSVEFAKFILPPAKFIVGQSDIPFASNYSGNWDSLYLFDSDTPSEVTPTTLVSRLYSSILGRLDGAEVRKLTLTYPNTYTGEQVSEIKKLVLKTLPNLCGRVNAVPESDAVVAHYLHLRRSNPLNKRKLKGRENILIYDMGAGTLDISYVEYQMISNSRKAVATITRKIGIPIAGNFLNLVLFEILKTDLDLGTDIWKAERRKSTLEDLKSSDVFASEKELNYAFKQGPDGEAKRKNSTDLINDAIMETYLKYCCEKVFQVLFGDNQWQDKIDTIVFSGRASRFLPLRRKIKELLGDCAEEKIDDITIADNELKKCVAIGAIQYTHAYSSENDKNRIQIVSHNQYYKLYAIYITHDEWNNSEVKCIQLIDPSSVDWDMVEVKDGTKSVGLVSDEFTISLDPEGRSVQIVQSLLSQEQLENLYRHLWFSNSPKAIIEDDCFVNEVANIPITELGDNLDDVKISIKVDVNNNIDLRINRSRYTGEKIRENIEENRYYTVNELLMKS